jgi:pseudaminic acid synthase
MNNGLQNKLVGEACPVFIIAEISANHGGSFDKAIALVKAAKDCGADAVKFQAYTAETLTINADNKYFHIEHPKWGGQTLYELYEKTYTPWEWFEELKKTADNAGIEFLCTAFDKTSVDMLEGHNIKTHKIASFELVDLDLIAYIAKTKKPLILSTGMANVCEIQDAVCVARKNGSTDITLLKCISSYPAEPEGMNLITIPHMKALFDCPVGFSDHSLGIGASVCAVTLGATVIEKHFVLSREEETPDSFFSIVPAELKTLVENVRVVEKAIGRIWYGTNQQEEKSKMFRRSLFIVEDVKAGDKFTTRNTRCIRPGHGLNPKHLPEILGRTAKTNIKRGTPLGWELIY